MAPNKQNAAAGAIPVWLAPAPEGSGLQSKSRNITTATTTLVNTGPGVFSGLGVNTAGAGSIAKVYDGIDATGVLLGTFNTAVLGPNNAPGGGYPFETGLCVVTSGGVAADITVAYAA